jgi:hypothetical protein
VLARPFSRKIAEPHDAQHSCDSRRSHRCYAFRRARNIKGIKRTLRNTVITTFGTDFAIANTESDRDGTTNRQSQTWVRMPECWRITTRTPARLLISQCRRIGEAQNEKAPPRAGPVKRELNLLRY